MSWVLSFAILTALTACGSTPTSTGSADASTQRPECPQVLIPDLDCLQEDCCRTNQDCIDYALCRGESDSTLRSCDLASHVCRHVDFSCHPASESLSCCPGQKCAPITNANGICGDHYKTCAENDASACTVKGQYCELELGTVGQQNPGCTFHRCNDGACENGLSCFNGYCVGEAPCDGGCGAGQVCTPVNNFCFNLGPTPPPTCRQSCPAGSMLVLASSYNVFGLCDMNDRTCQCEPLPTLTTP